MTLCFGARLVRFVQKLHNQRYDEKRKEWIGREAEQLIARLLYWSRNTMRTNIGLPQ